MFIYDFGDIVAWIFGGIAILLFCWVKLLIWLDDKDKRKKREKDEDKQNMDS